MSMCRIFSCVVGRGCLPWPVHTLGNTLLAFALPFCTPSWNLPVTPGISWLPTFEFQYPMMKVKLLSCVSLFATPWTVVYQAPPSMEFSRQEYWSALPFPSPGDLPDSGMEPGSPALEAEVLIIWVTREAQMMKRASNFGVGSRRSFKSS